MFKDETIQAIKEAIIDVEIKIPQQRYTDAKRSYNQATLLLRALKALCPDENTEAFEVKLKELQESAKEMENDVPEEITVGEQIVAHQWERGGNYSRGRLLGTIQTTEFKRKHDQILRKLIATKPGDVETQAASAQVTPVQAPTMGSSSK